MNIVHIALVGDYDPAVPAHQAIPKALHLSGERLGVSVDPVWMHTSTLDVSQLPAYAGIWCVPASPYTNTANALAAIRFARENNRPFLGTCGGFQHALLEYARNVLGLTDAQHAETRPDVAMPLIAPLSCSLVEKSGTIAFVEGSRLRNMYGAAETQETYHCNYGLSPHYERLFQDGALRICGRDRNGEVRAVELDAHPFFVATLYQPERAALHGKAHPLVNAFVAAATAPGVAAAALQAANQEVGTRQPVDAIAARLSGVALIVDATHAIGHDHAVTEFFHSLGDVFGRKIAGQLFQESAIARDQEVVLVIEANPALV